MGAPVISETRLSRNSCSSVRYVSSIFRASSFFIARHCQGRLLLAGEKRIKIIEKSRHSFACDPNLLESSHLKGVLHSGERGTLFEVECLAFTGEKRILARR
jgi:hypothetical protein